MLFKSFQQFLINQIKMAFLWLWLPTDTIQHGPTELLPAKVQAFQPEAAGGYLCTLLHSNVFDKSYFAFMTK